MPSEKGGAKDGMRTAQEYHIKNHDSESARIGRTSGATDPGYEAERECLRERNSTDGFMAYTDWVSAKPPENEMIAEPGGR